MKLSAKLALQHLRNNPKRTAWTLFSIVLATGMLVAIGGFGVSGAVGLEALIDTVDGIDSGTAEIISLSLAAVLGVVVAFVSAVVISNTFRVSAMERSKQFGILKSVGATKKQIHATVMYEGLFLLLAGLPLGLIAGFGMKALALVVINQMVDFSTISDTVRFRFEIEPAILLITIVLSTLAVLFSAWLPARKAAKTPA
ncbi:MAG: FtsX-like permease family protein, partial [Defluviitaleaceae bacterium]|nr:FtsX-like permease family protein [Defluviitaleaceae bacterium]